MRFVAVQVGSVEDNGSGGTYAYRASKSALNNGNSLCLDLHGTTNGQAMSFLAQCRCTYRHLFNVLQCCTASLGYLLALIVL